jgi:hypothetical protein
MEDQDLVKRNGLEFAARVAMLADDAPDHFGEIAVHQVVKQLHLHYGYSQRAKKAAIVSYLRKHISASRKELHDHFRWPSPVLYKLVNDMIAAGDLEAFKANGPGSGSKGGRPTLRFKLLPTKNA